MQQDHNSGNPCARDCNQEIHTQQTGQRASSAHEVVVEHNTGNRTHEDGYTEEDEKTLVRTTTLKESGRLKINKIDSSRDSLSPKIRRNIRGKEKSTSSLNDMAMLPFRSAIPGMSTGTGELRKGTMRSK